MKNEKHYQDDRTDAYLKAIKERIGFLGSIQTENEQALKKIIDGKDEQGRYIAEGDFFMPPDAVVYTQHFFSNPPSDKDVETAKLLEQVAWTLYNKPKEFQCWECGATRHWLDTPGALAEKLEHWKDQYCGC